MSNKKSENEPAYLPIGMCLGVAIGAAVGTAMDSIGTWMCLGVAFGVGIGSMLDQNARKKAENKPSGDTEDEKTEE